MIDLKKNINPLEIILYYLILLFPIFFLFRSFTLNFIIIAISLIFLFLSFKIKHNFLQKKYNIFLLIFFLYVILLNLILYQNSETLVKSFFLLKFFLLFNATIFVYSRIEKKFLIRNLNFLFIFILIISIDFIIQYITGNNLIGIKPGHCDGNFENCQRYSGFFGSELVLGGYFSTVIFSSFLLIKIFKKGFFNFIPIFILLVVFLSGERSAFLLSFVFCLIFYSLTIKFNTKNTISIIFLIFILITSINFFAKDSTKARYYSDIKSLLNFDQPNLIETLKLTPWGLHYDASISIILDKPLFGNGLKSFRVKCKKYEKERIGKLSEYRACSTHPHNFHLEILVDTGLLGYSLFLIFIFYLIRDLKKSDTNKKLILNLIILYIIIFIFLPRPTGSIFSTFFGTIHWYFLGSLFGYSQLIKTNNENSQ